MHDVTVLDPGFWTPRMVIHMCLGCGEIRLGRGAQIPFFREKEFGDTHVASMTTATPRG